MKSEEIRVILDPEDDIIAYFYLRLKRDGLLDRVFHDALPSLRWMAEYFSDRSRPVAAIVVDRGETTELVGMGWLSSVSDLRHRNGKTKIGEAAAAFFAKVSPSVVREAADRLLAIAFEDLDFDVVYVTTAEPNRAARILLKACGFSLCGRLPSYTVWRGQLCDGLVWAKTKLGRTACPTLDMREDHAKGKD